MDLSAYAGESVYIAFRNNSDDMFLLLIDDIKITYKAAPDAPPAPVMASRTDTSITLEEIDGAEYSMDNGETWQDSPVFSGLSPNTSYSFVARIKETESAYASAVSAASKITTYGASNGSPETSDTMRTFRIVILIALMAASFSALVFVVRKRKTMKSPV